MCSFSRGCGIAHTCTSNFCLEHKSSSKQAEDDCSLWLAAEDPRGFSVVSNIHRQLLDRRRNALSMFVQAVLSLATSRDWFPVD